MLSRNILPLSVGALLYTPATNTTIAQSIITNHFENPYSLSLCMEDAIGDSSVGLAKKQLVSTFLEIEQALHQGISFYLPLIFIRVRQLGQMKELYSLLGSSASLLTGFIVPKFCPDNSKIYIHELKEVNQNSSRPVYMMPILESPSMISLRHRTHILYTLKDQLYPIRDLILNIRVGGNDLCHSFALRRNKYQTIYDILTISSLLADILTAFSRDYIVSGVVWEYFNGDNDDWKKGLEKELSLDLLNGFLGKTVIHPNQIPIVNAALAVSSNDYEDACSILNWDNTSTLMVSKNSTAERMNEMKTHSNWAEQIIALKHIYGIKK